MRDRSKNKSNKQSVVDFTLFVLFTTSESNVKTIKVINKSYQAPRPRLRGSKDQPYSYDVEELECEWLSGCSVTGLTLSDRGLRTHIALYIHKYIYIYS